jgi:acetyltransferase-like isoleucine patch superfamily enzyme
MGLLQKLAYRWRRGYLRSRGIELGSGGYLGPGIIARPGTGRIKIGQNCSLENGAMLDAYGGIIEIGHSVFIGPYTVIYGHGGVNIGEGSLIAMHCRILSSNHTLPPLGTPIRSQPDVLLPTRIGRDVWLGAGVTVLGGVTIGDGCIVGGGAVVTKDLPTGAIAAGVPAAITKYRAGSFPTG